MKCNLIFFGLLLFSLLHAQEENVNQEFQVNTNWEGAQLNPRIATLDDSGFVILWSDERLSRISGQIFNSDGLRRGTEFIVHQSSEDFFNKYVMYEISPLKNGGFVVIFEQIAEQTYDVGVFAKIFNSEGVELNEAIPIDTSSSSWEPAIADRGNGSFICIWTTCDNKCDVFGQIYTYDGNTIGDRFKVNIESSEEDAGEANIGIFPDHFIVCWKSWFYDAPGYSAEIRSQVFDFNGNKVADESSLSGIVTGNLFEPHAVVLSDSLSLIWWKEMEYTEDGEIRNTYLQYVDHNNEKIGLKFIIAEAPPWADLIYIPGAKINYYLTPSSYSHDIYCRLYTTDYTALTPLFRINDYTYYFQSEARISKFSENGFIIAWESMGQDGYNCGIYAKYCHFYHPLQAFSLIEPLDDSSLDRTSVHLKWQSASRFQITFPWEIEYFLYLDENPEFSSPMIFNSIHKSDFFISELSPGTTYFWKVCAKNVLNDSLWSSETKGFFITYDATVVDDQIRITPSPITLISNYPNPFNPQTQINFYLPSPGKVRIMVFNTAGQKISTLFDGVKTAGLHSLVFYAEGLTSGVYFYRIEANGFTSTRKMVYIQ